VNEEEERAGKGKEEGLRWKSVDVAAPGEIECPRSSLRFVYVVREERIRLAYLFHRTNAEIWKRWAGERTSPKPGWGRYGKTYERSIHSIDCGLRIQGVNTKQGGFWEVIAFVQGRAR